MPAPFLDMTEQLESLLTGHPQLPPGCGSLAEAIGTRGPAAALAETRGHFGVAVRQPGGGVVLATDRFGRHSVCWRQEGSEVRFAERADAFGVREIDPQAIFDYLYFHVIPSPRTIFKGVHRVPAAHMAVQQPGAQCIRVGPYWRAPFRPVSTPSFEALKAEFRDLLNRSVAAELDGGTPACFLSGGTDSSTVTGCIARVAGRVSTYSIGFDAEGYDEMSYARIAAQHFGADHHEYYVTPDDLVRSIPDVAAAYDQPFGNSSALPAYYCALNARGDGVTKLLAGDGGDELFGGNSRYAMQRLYGLYGALPSFVRKGLLDPVFGDGRMAGVPLLRKGSSYVRDARIPLPDRLQNYNLLQRLGLDEVLSPALLAAVDRHAPLAHQRQVWQLAEADNDVDRMLAFDWRYTLGEADLPKVVGTTRLAGLDVGFPLLSDELLDFSLRLPTSYKLRRFKLRWFFKEALRDFLPEAIITKQKKGFGLPFGVWANRHAGLMALANDSLRSLSTRGLVQPGFIHTLLDTHLKAHPGYYGEMVWILMMLEQWLRHHLPDYRFER